MAKDEKLTPMMKQYFSIKKHYPEAILFYRLGDFYEMFYEDALIASKILEITLTSRNKNAEDPIPMCGVPYHSANEYIRKLINAGYKVAICEQMEDSRQTKGMVKREVIQVITPGTILQDQAIPNKENNYLACIHFQDQKFYLVYIDVTTGEIYLTSTSNFSQFFTELQSIHASELIISNEFPEDVKDKIQEAMNIYISNASENNKDYHGVWFLDDAETGEKTSLNILFNYLDSIHMQSMDHIKKVVRYQINQYMQMNHYAKLQLELTKSLRTQRRKGSLLSLIDKTQTAMGGRLLHQWLDKPLINMEQIHERHQYVEQLINYYFERLDLVQTLNQVYDLERLISKISMATANARDLDQLRNSLKQIPRINQILQLINGDNEGINKQSFKELQEFTELVEKIDQTLIDNPPISITEGDLIPTGYNEELDEYRDALVNGQNWLVELQQRERERTGIKTLKVGFNKVFGYYIEMSRLQAQNFNDENYTRKQTLTNSERFITQELKEMESTILNAKDKSKALEYELFIELRAYVGRFTKELQNLAHEVAKLDVLACFASISEEEAYCRPILTQEIKHFELKDSRHPVVEKLIGKSNFVANDFKSSSQEYFLLLTGPNMSGKSTYMRQIAYAVILNQMGCFVPAREALMPIFDKIFTRIGSADDVASGQSTFMVEMKETNTALQEASEASLILFDEIGRGTATYDGLALADGIIKYLAQEIKAVTIFSTHYHELTELENHLPMVKNIHVGAQEYQGDLIFLHKVLDGPADKSYGIQVAKLAGLPPAVIEESMEVLADLEAKAKELKLNQSGIEEFTLFDDFEDDHQEIIKELIAIDINQVSPMEAFNILHDILMRIHQ